VKIELTSYPGKALFECSRIRIDPHVLGWIKVEHELNSTQSTLTHVDWGESDNIKQKMH
jgi:hypothetical protein